MLSRVRNLVLKIRVRSTGARLADITRRGGGLFCPSQNLARYRRPCARNPDRQTAAADRPVELRRANRVETCGAADRDARTPDRRIAPSVNSSPGLTNRLPLLAP